MSKRTLLTVTIALSVFLAAAIGVAMASGNEDAEESRYPASNAEDNTGGTFATSIDDIDPDQCNWIHNIDACGDLEPFSVDIGYPDDGGTVAISVDGVEPYQFSDVHDGECCQDPEPPVIEPATVEPVAEPPTVESEFSPLP